MTLKLAELKDLEGILRIAEDFHRASGYGFSFDEATVEKLVHQLLSVDTNLVLLEVQPHGPVGLLAAAVVNHPFFNIPFASDIMFWVDPEYRKLGIGQQLIQAYEYWAVNKQQAQIVTLVSLADERVDAMYSRLGYQKREHTWSKTFNASN